MKEYKKPQLELVHFVGYDILTDSGEEIID